MMIGVDPAEQFGSSMVPNISRSTGGVLAAHWIVCAIWCIASTAAAVDVQIHPLELHTNEFGGRETTRRFRIESDQPLTARFVWSLSAQQRTLARGEQDIHVAGMGDEVSIQFRLESLRDEVILPLTLRVAVVVDQRQISSEELRLWLFPEDPFLPRSEWLRSLDITLFDPAENTATVFDDAEIPYRPARNSAALDNVPGSGVLMIGEGVSLRQHRGLGDAALRAAAKGRRVILLAPADGALPVPGSGGHNLAGSHAPGELRLVRHQVIVELDKRLDSQAWAGTNNTIPSRRLLIESHRGRVEATVSEESHAWPWVEVRFPETDGVFVVCGFRIIEHWNRGPTPRFLMVRLLESLSLPSIKILSEETD
ncbi:MAG: hypothetical protein ACO1RT_05555 [Planctomycetaceae bacterium]